MNFENMLNEGSWTQSIHIIYFHLYEMCRRGKSIERDSRDGGCSVLESLSVANVGDSQSSLLQHGAKGNLHETDKSPFTSLSPTTLFMIVFTLSHFEVTLSRFQSLSYFQKL